MKTFYRDYAKVRPITKSIAEPYVDDHFAIIDNDTMDYVLSDCSKEGRKIIKLMVDKDLSIRQVAELTRLF